MPERSQSIDDYLAGLSADKREALEAIRRTVRAAAPDAEECLTYGKPAFRQGGMLLAFGASTHHCAVYPWNGTWVGANREILKDFETSSGTIRFTPDKPLPADIVRKLVRDRIADNQARKRRR